MLRLSGDGVSEDRIETYIFWTYTRNIEITMLLIDKLWPTALEGSLDMLIWLISTNHAPDYKLGAALERRIKEILTHQIEGLHEQKSSTLTSLESFFVLLYYQEMKNSALSGLREAVAQWMVCNSDELFQKPTFARSLLQTLPGLKYMFAKAWVGIRRTRLPHRWVDALRGEPISSIAVATDSDEPADFDGFDAWEQSAKRRELDPGFNDKGAPDPTPPQTKSVRFLENNYSKVDPLADLMRRRYVSPSPQLSISSDSSFGKGESTDLTAYQLAVLFEGSSLPSSPNRVGDVPASMFNAFQIDLGGGQSLPTVPERGDTHSDSSSDNGLSDQ